MQTLDLLIVPSRWQEPFGRIVVESYSVGVPVLCLRRGGLPELVQPGKTGWVQDDWDPDQLAAVIADCPKVDRQAILDRAGDFTPTTIAQNHLAFYQSVIDNR